MPINRFFAPWALLFLGIFVPSSWAAPLSGEINLVWWANDFEADVLDGEVDAGALGLTGEIWADKWGIGSALYRSDLKNTATDGNIDYFNVDIKRRLVSVTENNFLALGLGWENIDFGDGSNTTGPRLLLQGRLGLTPILYLYGQTAWLPTLEETATRKNPNGFEVEAGVSIVPFPYLSLRAGYRQFNVDSTSIGGENVSSKSKGIVAGAGIHW